MAKTKTTTFRYDPALMDRVDRLAEQCGMSRNELIEMSLEKQLDRDWRDVRADFVNGANATLEAANASADLFS